MLRPLEIGIGLRYLRARRRTRFVSFITLASMLGISIGVAALIVILSVMNGLEGELRTRLLSMTAHASVSGPGGRLDDWRAALALAEADPAVTGAAPVIHLEAMARAGGELVPLMVNGVDPRYEDAVSDAGNNLVVGELDSLAPGSRAILLGRSLALRLGVGRGDGVVALIPRPAAAGIEPELVRFVVAGVFEAGIADHDTSLALVHLEDAAAILGRPGEADAVRLRLADLFAARSVAERIAARLDPRAVASDWMSENASYFRAIRLEKTMMALMLSLIVAVAAFNVVASLVMVVTDKEGDIAILRTLGLAPGGVMRVFLTQGLAIGWVGALGGVLLGVALAPNVPEIVPVLERAFGFQIMSSDVYYVTRIPSDMQWDDVFGVAAAALVLTGLATLYPARRAAAVLPARALRHE